MQNQETNNNNKDSIELRTGDKSPKWIEELSRVFYLIDSDTGERPTSKQIARYGIDGLGETIVLSITRNPSGMDDFYRVSLGAIRDSESEQTQQTSIYISDFSNISIPKDCTQKDFVVFSREVGSDKENSAQLSLSPSGKFVLSG